MSLIKCKQDTYKSNNTLSSPHKLAKLYIAHLDIKTEIYSRALIATGFESVIIASGTLKQQFRDDLSETYYCNPYFKEWVPLFHKPNCYLVIKCGCRPCLYIYQDDDYWNSLSPVYGNEISSNLEIIEFSEKLNIAPQPKTAFIGRECNYSNILEKADVNPNGLLNFIDYYRAWKTEYEQQCIREANKRAVVGHVKAKSLFQVGCSEYEIHMAYLSAISSREFNIPYANIIGINENASVLHHMDLSHKRPAQSRSMLIDAGAYYKGYASDISRTYSAKDSLPEYVAIIEGINQLQQKLVSETVPGKSYLEIHILAHQLIAQLLCDIKLINCNVDQCINNDLTSIFFPHGIGHLLGIQVHDRGGHLVSPNGEVRVPPEKYPHLRCTRTIESSMVFTIEPGVYFIPKLLEKYKAASEINHKLLQELIPYGGVRIEDNIIANTQGAENLTRSAFSIDDVVEDVLNC